jgi:membrane fusion protein (multidrug efflux system)
MKMRNSRNLFVFLLSIITTPHLFAAPPKPSTPLVTVVTAQKQPIHTTLNAVGRLSATKLAQVRARVDGIILKRNFDEGAYVNAGQLLFEIDPASLKATLHARQAALLQAKASAKNAALNAERSKGLAKTKLLSPQDLDNALANERTSAAAVQEAKANLDIAKLNLSYAKVTAPISGYIDEAQVSEGTLVSATAATLLTNIQQINPIYVNFRLPVNQYLALKNSETSHQPVKLSVSLKENENLTLTGVLTYQGSTVDPNTGTIKLRGTLNNPKSALLPGMFVNVTTILNTEIEGYYLPQSAISRDTNGAFVLTVNDKGIVEQHRIITHAMTQSDWAVTGDIKQGDHIIITGLQKVHPGSKAKIQIALQNSQKY